MMIVENCKAGVMSSVKLEGAVIIRKTKAGNFLKFLDQNRFEKIIEDANSKMYFVQKNKFRVNTKNIGSCRYALCSGGAPVET